MTTVGGVMLYGSIWLGIACFVTGEIGKRQARSSHGWAWRVWLAGGILTTLHVALAFDLVHNWDHAAALETTARQTESLYGVSWRGGLYVNYIFLGVWLSEIAWWRLNPLAYFGRPAAVTLLVRSFYFVMLVNAAIVFVHPGRRAIGLGLVGLLLWAWRPLPYVPLVSSAASRRAI